MLTLLIPCTLLFTELTHYFKKNHTLHNNNETYTLMKHFVFYKIEMKKNILQKEIIGKALDRNTNNNNNNNKHFIL